MYRVGKANLLKKISVVFLLIGIVSLTQAVSYADHLGITDYIIFYGEVNDIAFSNSSQFLAIQAIDGVHIYDADGIPSMHFEVSITSTDAGFPEVSYGIIGVAWGMSDEALITPYRWAGDISAGTRLKLRDLSDNSYIDIIDESPPSAIMDIAWNYSKNIVAIAHTTPVIQNAGPYIISFRDINSDNPSYPYLAFGRSHHWITKLDWHPNGRWLAAAYSSGEIKIWDTEHNDLAISNSIDYQNTQDNFLRTFERQFEISANAVSWSPDGAQLASAGSDSRIIIAEYSDASTYSNVQDFRTVNQIIIDQSFGAVLTIAWNNDGTLLASAGEEGVVYIWDSESGSLVAELTGHSGSVHRLDWSKDGNWIATAGRDKTVRLWDVSVLGN